MIITILILPVLVAWMWKTNRRIAGQWPKRKMWASMVGAVILICFIVALVGRGAAWRRWAQLPDTVGWNNPRILMLRVGVPLARDSGPWGYGPGSFKLIFPGTKYMLSELYPRWKVMVYRPNSAVSVYSYVDNDFVQYVIEWGWIGGLIWACFLGGGIRFGCALCAIAQRRTSGSERGADVGVGRDISSLLN